MRAAILLLFLATPALAQVPCPNPSGGFTVALTGAPRMMTFDSMQNQMTFFWSTTLSGLTNTFIDVDQTVAQQCSVTRDGPICWGMVFGIYQQLLLTRQWNCPVTTMAGGLLQSVIP